MQLINILFSVSLFAAVAVSKDPEEIWDCYNDCIDACNAPAGGSCPATCLISCSIPYDGGSATSSIDLDTIVDNVNGRLVCW